jgi:hypothetical protein
VDVQVSQYVRPYFEQMEQLVAQQGRDIAEDFSILEKQVEHLQMYITAL